MEERTNMYRLLILATAITCGIAAQGGGEAPATAPEELPAILTLKEAKRQALAGNPSILAAHDRVLQARERVKQARAAYLPRLDLDYTASRTRLSENAVAVVHKGIIRCVYALACSWDMCGESPVDFAWDAIHQFELDESGKLLHQYRSVPLLKS